MHDSLLLQELQHPEAVDPQPPAGELGAPAESHYHFALTRRQTET